MSNTIKLIIIPEPSLFKNPGYRPVNDPNPKHRIFLTARLDIAKIASSFHLVASYVVLFWHGHKYCRLLTSFPASAKVTKVRFHHMQFQKAKVHVSQFSSLLYNVSSFD